MGIFIPKRFPRLELAHSASRAAGGLARSGQRYRAANARSAPAQRLPFLVRAAGEENFGARLPLSKAPPKFHHLGVQVRRIRQACNSSISAPAATTTRMWRRTRLFGRAAAALTSATGCAHVSLSASPSLAEASETKSPAEEPSPAQWLWSIDGVALYRDKSGDVVYVDQQTGETLPDRPNSVPNEAYANRVRFPPHPDWNAEKVPRRSGAVRHVLLVRHSQYNVNGATDAERALTALGTHQAALVGKRLASIHACDEGSYANFALDSMISSGLTRAIQTADLIAPQLPGATRARNDATLNEGRPCLPEPAPRHASHYTNKNGDGERIEAAYRLICAVPPAPVPPATRADDVYEVIVCHANVIRYVVCRALQLPPEAWLRISLPHASLTHLVVRSSGCVTLRMLGDAGHLPPEMVTY